MRAIAPPRVVGAEEGLRWCFGWCRSDCRPGGADALLVSTRVEGGGGRRPVVVSSRFTVCGDSRPGYILLVVEGGAGTIIGSCSGAGFCASTLRGSTRVRTGVLAMHLRNISVDSRASTGRPMPTAIDRTKWVSISYVRGSPFLHHPVFFLKEGEGEGGRGEWPHRFVDRIDELIVRGFATIP